MYHLRGYLSSTERLADGLLEVITEVTTMACFTVPTSDTSAIHAMTLGEIVFL
jgi:hypothetical protein